MAHGQWTEVEARGVLEAWRKSGASIEAFARGRGLVPQRLYWWKRKLGIAGRRDRAALVPVRLAEPPDGEVSDPRRRGEPVTVLLRSGHMLKIGRDFDEHAFARVVALLEHG
jgi:hypothetical protein